MPRHQRVEVFLDEVAAAADARESRDHALEDEQVRNADHEQKRSGENRADRATGLVNAVETAADARRRCGNDEGCENDDGRMAEGEEEADRLGLPSRLHHLAHDIVDGGYVVGIESVTEPEGIGQEGRAQQHRASAERHPRPSPGKDVGRDERGVKRNDPGRRSAWSIGDGWQAHVKSWKGS